MKPVKSTGKWELARRVLAFLFFVSVVQVFKPSTEEQQSGTNHRTGQQLAFNNKEYHREYRWGMDITPNYCFLL